jgi:hypothetical protein
VLGASKEGEGIFGESTKGPGVRGESNTGPGVKGKTDTGAGVSGESTTGTGVHGSCDDEKGIGVFGGSQKGVGVYGMSATGLAGRFEGNVKITGNLEKGGGGFKIDHPLDPQRRFLNHSFVESPERTNIYSGTVLLDTCGRALVRLPLWFSMLNRDFRYQLTPLGTPMPNLHIAEELTANQFAIAGGTPGFEVCWQVSGVRQDAWALAHPLLVEEDKTGLETVVGMQY